MSRPSWSRRIAGNLASAGFVVLIVGITYFAMLVLAIQFAEQDERGAAYYELAMFLSGRLEWFKDARVYGAVSLLLSLLSLLFGVHRLARITIPVSGAIYATLHIWGDRIGGIITEWAKGA